MSCLFICKNKKNRSWATHVSQFFKKVAAAVVPTAMCSADIYHCACAEGKGRP